MTIISTPESELQYWSTVLSSYGQQSLQLPTDFPAVVASDNSGMNSDTNMGTPTKNASSMVWSESVILTHVPGQDSISLVSHVLAMFGVVLERYTAEQRFVVLASLVQCQGLKDDLRLVEFDFESTSVSNTEGNNPSQPSARNLVVKITRACTDLHEQYTRHAGSMSDVIDKLQEEGHSLQLKQMIQVTFSAAQGSHEEQQQQQQSIVDSMMDKTGIQGVSMHLHLDIDARALKILYRPDLFSAERITATLQQLVSLMKQVTDNPAVLLGDLSLAPERHSDSRQHSANLPDPTAPLPNAWNGSVVYHLEQQAANYPDRIALIDSEDKLTYAEFNALANQLARRLILQGVKKGDIVGIFGHRSIAMVWAIAAVLKCGAAYCVLDPIYPAARIIGCLQVASPVGIIVVDAIGRMPTKVMNYLNERHETSTNTAQFVYLLQSPLAERREPEESDIIPLDSSNLTDIEIGPQDLAVLTYTSGSTGVPKGVLGRHGPLTHFYPWMKKRFNLSFEDRFSMQSGIAHDPLQRDIFTPWFLGATLFIPSNQDIANPGRLAQWFSEKRISVSHLTPAMGQLLTTVAPDSDGADAVLLPSLRLAFFVGDVLTKKFVRRLCSISPQLQVINLYGSTETQRSVSYFAVPRPDGADAAAFDKLKDLIPVGVGMEGAQCLVLSRVPAGSSSQYRLAGVGELGEIFMRGCHLSRGYKDHDAETEAKFIWNPFIPQDEAVNRYDRMYRTGDLGRYLPSGDVECVGRADNQVKIRGFRIELGEINTALNSHDYVKESITIVRSDIVPDSDEKRIVSYVVFDKADKDVIAAMVNEGDDPGRASSARSTGMLLQDLRRYLRAKLPEYMIPAAFVPLDKLPLTPNGKIHFAKLPKPEGNVHDEDEGYRAPRTELERHLCEVWSEVLGVKRIGVHSNFFDLGGHSISATQLTFKIRTQISGAQTLPVEVLYTAPTVAAMAIAIENLRSGELTETSVVTNVIDLTPDTVLDVNIVPKSTQRSTKWLRPTSILLTGATGFLGSFLLSDLLKHTSAKVYCLVRAPTEEEAFEKVKRGLLAHKLVWDVDTKKDSFVPDMLTLDKESRDGHDFHNAGGSRASDKKMPGLELYEHARRVYDKWNQMIQERIVVQLGDLSKPLIGIPEDRFASLADSVDLVLHNGALVHWMYPYEKLRATNVRGTEEILRLCCAGRTVKPLHYVSTTSVFDSDQYMHMSDIYETTDLPYHEDLRGGYAQSKYVAEKLVMAARKRGVPSCIYRCGYISGHSVTGVWGVDDFLCRMMKGCIMLGQYPDLSDTKLDVTPVDYVSRAIVHMMLREDSLFEHKAYHMVNPNEFHFKELFETAERLGYRMIKAPFEAWKRVLVESATEQRDSSQQDDENPLYALLTFFGDDYATRMRTKRPWYDNTFTLAAMRDSGIDCPPVLQLLGTYYRFMVQIGYLEPPAEPTRLAIERFGFDVLSPRSALSESGLLSEYNDSDEDNHDSQQDIVLAMRRSTSTESLRSLMRNNRA